MSKKNEGAGAMLIVQAKAERDARQKLMKTAQALTPAQADAVVDSDVGGRREVRRYLN